MLFSESVRKKICPHLLSSFAGVIMEEEPRPPSLMPLLIGHLGGQRDHGSRGEQHDWLIQCTSAQVTVVAKHDPTSIHVHASDQVIISHELSYATEHKFTLYAHY